MWLNVKHSKILQRQKVRRKIKANIYISYQFHLHCLSFPYPQWSLFTENKVSIHFCGTSLFCLFFSFICLWLFPLQESLCRSLSFFSLSAAVQLLVFLRNKWGKIDTFAAKVYLQLWSWASFWTTWEADEPRPEADIFLPCGRANGEGGAGVCSGLMGHPFRALIECLLSASSDLFYSQFFSRRFLC